MKKFFMDLEFLCDAEVVYEEDIIAICILSEDDTYEFTSHVRPYDDEFDVSEYCTNLTGISKADLEDQPYFDDIHEIMLDTIGPEDEIYVWGDVDLEAIYKLSVEIAGELSFKIIDFQEDVMSLCGYKFRPGLQKVYEALTGDCDQKHHDVRSDTIMLKEIYKLYHEDQKATMRKIKGRIK
jgi:inhibitor of KinA sporulation pathway (predicted exonuclease)